MTLGSKNIFDNFCTWTIRAIQISYIKCQVDFYPKKCQVEYYYLVPRSKQCVILLLTPLVPISFIAFYLVGEENAVGAVSMARIDPRIANEVYGTAFTPGEVAKSEGLKVELATVMVLDHKRSRWSHWLVPIKRHSKRGFLCGYWRFYLCHPFFQMCCFSKSSSLLIGWFILYKTWKHYFL